MIIVFYFLALVLVLLSYKSFRGGIAYLRFFRSELEKPPSAFTPFVTVIAPCRGLDEGLADNLLALTHQDYPAYEIIFVVDSADEDAVPVIHNLLNCGDAENTDRAKYLVIAPKADGCSQKVENLREAVLHAADRSEAYVFVDSDVRPSPDWLRHLAAALEDETIGAATAYRWFISRRMTIGSEMRSVWNASIASALGQNTLSNFCWGGSMAIRRATFERIDMREKWRGTLSDDFAVTQAMNSAGLPIVFVPLAMTASIEDCSFIKMLEFTTRQMKITRVYAPHLWLMSFVGTGLFNIVMIAAAVIAVIYPQDSLAFWAAVFTLVSVTMLSIGKSWLRLMAIKLVFADYKAELNRQAWTQNSLWLLAPAVFFYNSVAALASKRIIWRGTLYELKSPTETVIIAD